MATEKNLVTITGYLKENTLEQVVSKNGKNVIRGNLIIATSEVESHRVQFYVSETTSTGAESKEYKNLLEMLPSKTQTIASILESDHTATFASALESASKVWVAGYFDEYVKRTETGDLSSIQIRGRRAGFRTATATSSPFEPKTHFEVEVYIYEMSPELDSKGDETGRTSIVGLLQNYDRSMIRVNFVAPTEDGISDYIKNNFSVSDTVHLNGVLVNVMHRVLVESAGESHFGAGGRDQYSTTFINERQITGGDTKSLKEGADGSITKSAVKTGLAKRESKILANSTKAPSTTVRSAFTPRDGSASDEVDF